MSSIAGLDEFSLLKHRDFRFFWLTRISATLAYQMAFVAVGWQVYDLTGSTFDLGLVGLLLFLPTIFTTLVAGHAADHYDRRLVVRFSQIGKAIAVGILAVGSFLDVLNTPAIFAAVFVFGACRAFDGPTMNSLLPSIVPASSISRAVAASTTANQASTISGPAIGGALYVFGPGCVYLICALIFIGGSLLVGLIHLQHAPPKEKKPVTMETIFAGVGYLRGNPILLGALSLDLCAVMLGGVIALLPVFARDFLHSGPLGLGLLRSAPALGALAVTISLAHFSFRRRVGNILIGAIVMFGLSVIVFGLSRSFLLSLGALVIYGAANALNVVIRHSLVQTRTPNDKLGRVAAVGSLFSSSAESLGQFESGLTASLFGVVPSVLIGGFGAIAIALLWIRVFPGLWRVQRIVPDS